MRTDSRTVSVLFSDLSDSTTGGGTAWKRPLWRRAGAFLALAFVLAIPVRAWASPPIFLQGPNFGTWSIGQVETGLTATGGDGVNYTWEVISGSLPPGISLRSDRELFFPDDVFREYQRLVKTLVREDKIFVSDRKLVKLYKLFRVRAWLFSGGTVSRDDLRLLSYLGETPEEMAHLRLKVPTLLGEA